jgi:serine/threonine protein kinase
MSGDIEAGAIVNSAYEVKRLLGRGSASDVYLACDLLHLREVVLKIVPRKGDAGAAGKMKPSLLKKEFMTLRKLSYPLLPRVYDYFESEDRSILVEEYIEGITLKDRVNELSCTDIRENLRIVYQVMGALHYLNKRRIIYRDLKPGNIIVTGRGEAKLVDFDAARMFRKGKKTDTIPLGTLGFASPEHYGYSQTDERSDVFSAGALLYFLLTRCNPADNPLIFEVPRTVNPAISEELSNIILKATRLEPEERYGTIRDFKTSLQRAAGAYLDKERLLFCPLDLKEMDLIRVGYILLDICPHCAGLWCDALELDKIEALEHQEVVSSMNAYWDSPSRSGIPLSIGEDSICCPLCGSVTAPYLHSTEPRAQVNRCPEGCGHWLDGGVMKMIAAALVDEKKGGEKLWRRLREIRDTELKPLLMRVLKGVLG